MLIKQLSVFLENKEGRLAEVTRILAEAGVDINALVISDTTDFGILRLIVKDSEKAYEVLKKNQFTVSFTNVVVISMSDFPGSLSKVLEVLDKDGIGIEYMYAFLGRKIGQAPAVLRVEDTERAIKLLEENNIKLLSESDL